MDLFRVLQLITVVILLGQNRGHDAATAVAKSLEFGEECHTENGSSDVHCNIKHRLHCVDSSCACLPGAFYDDTSKSCKAGLGKPCVTKEDCTGNLACNKINLDPFGLVSMKVRLPTSLQREVDRITALRQAKFQNIKLCYCPTGFIQTSSKRTCVKRLQFEETCTAKLRKSGVDCDPFAGLTCTSAGICGCQGNGTAFYDKDLKRCITRFGEKCTLTAPCEDGAICPKIVEHVQRSLITYSGQGWKNINRQFLVASQAEADRCVCNSGYKANKEGKCAGSYKAECSQTTPCNVDGFLTCIGGFCQCEKGTMEIFMEGNGTSPSCHLTPGSPCNTKEGPTCAGNTVCKHGECQCGEGFSLATSMNCLMNYGTTCKVSSTNGCNFFQGLACIASECSCFDSSLTWNAKEKICAAKEGSRCGKFKSAQGGISGGVDPLSESAAENAEAEFYFAGCEHGFTCTKDEISSFSVCKKTEG